MEQPKGFEEPGKEDYVWKLEKGIYGIPQGGRLWNQRMHEAMVKFGFTRVSVKHSIYSQTREEGRCLIAVHVDDFCIAADSKSEMASFKEELASEFEITDLGEVKWILGISVTRDRSTRSISLSQDAYVEKMLQHFGMTDATHLIHPCLPRKSLPEIWHHKQMNR